MCGIAGILVLGGGQARAGADAELIERMTRALAHRGPDAHHTIATGPIHLGHRRLSVIDPSPDADQPMRSADAAHWIVFNGEIYNHDEQRRRLVAKGHRFRTRSDTEVVLALFREHGEACVEHLRGMFAFAIWDGPQRRLFLARDRIGKKPLYYRASADRFVFASEIKALLCDPAVPRDLDPTAIHDFLSFAYVPGPGTIFPAIRQLPPAHAATVDARGLRLWRYWRAQPGGAPPPGDARAVADEIVRRLSDAIDVRLMADVPLGVFLSGGVDSAAIVALLRGRHPDLPIRTFTLGFAEPGRDERPRARLIARAFATEHHEFSFVPRFDTHLEEIVAHHDQPFADPSMLPTWELARQARAHVTVALTGEGGDEGFAGYDRYVKSALAALWYRVPGVLRSGAAAILDRLSSDDAPQGGLGRRLKEFCALGQLPPADLFGRWLLHFDHEAKHDVCTEDFWRAAGGRDSTARIRALHEESAGRDALNKLLDVDAQTYLPDDLLVKVDMATMRHGLEARCPFLDQELLDYVATLPGRFKLRGLTTKWILRRALRGRLPRATLARRKLGFGPPVHLWLRGALHDHARAVLTDRRAEQRGYFAPRAVRRLLDEHASGRRNHGYQLWNLFVLELWQRALVDRAPEAARP